MQKGRKFYQQKLLFQWKFVKNFPLYGIQQQQQQQQQQLYSSSSSSKQTDNRQQIDRSNGFILEHTHRVTISSFYLKQPQRLGMQVTVICQFGLIVHAISAMYHCSSCNLIFLLHVVLRWLPQHGGTTTKRQLLSLTKHERTPSRTV